MSQGIQGMRMGVAVTYPGAKNPSYSYFCRAHGSTDEPCRCITAFDRKQRQEAYARNNGAQDGYNDKF